MKTALCLSYNTSPIPPFIDLPLNPQTQAFLNETPDCSFSRFATKREVIARTPSPKAASEHYYDVHAVAELDATGNVVFSIFCEGTAFTQVEYGKELFNAVSRHILQHRKNQGRYPCYITDLNLSSIQHKLGQNSFFSINQYFQFKFKLEHALNQALFAV